MQIPNVNRSIFSSSHSIMPLWPNAIAVRHNFVYSRPYSNNLFLFLTSTIQRYIHCISMAYIYISRFQPWRLFSDADCWCDVNSNIMYFSLVFLIALHKICRLNHIPWGYQLFIGIKTFDRDLSWLWRNSVFSS